MARTSLLLNAVLGLTAACACAKSPASSTEYILDPARTVVSFEVRRFGMSTQAGEFASVVGTVQFDPDAGQGFVEIAVDTRSIRAGSETMEKFLRGPGVLNVERYSKIAYKADDIVFAAGKPQLIHGELTLLGVTRPLTLNVVGYTCTEAQVPGARRCKLDATATFKRSSFGMTRYLAIVSDEVKLAIHGVADDAGG